MQAELRGYRAARTASSHRAFAPKEHDADHPFEPEFEPTHRAPMPAQGQRPPHQSQRQKSHYGRGAAVDQAGLVANG